MPKQWEVIKASKDHFTGLGIDGRFGKKHFRKFGKHGAFTVNDPGEARYIQEAFGSRSKTGDGSVVVCEVDKPGSSSFVINAPWKEEEDGTGTEGN